MICQTKISIAMAVYNGERFIREQLDSFLRQNQLPDELVISDNASTDSTAEIVRDFAVSAPFAVRLFVNERNLGIGQNFARAISECSGDIIFLSDCDDVWYSDKIRSMTAALSASPKSALAVCDALLVDERLQPLGCSLWQSWGFTPRTKEITPLANGEVFSPSVPWFGACMAFRASLKPLILPIPPDKQFQRCGHDSFIARTIICSGAGGTALVPRPLQAYRQHLAQATGVGKVTWVQRLSNRLNGRALRPTHILAPVISRLAELSGPHHDTKSPMLTEALHHFRTRCELPANKLLRVPIIARELASHRYQRFSGGLIVAIKDLMFVR